MIKTNFQVSYENGGEKVVLNGRDRVVVSERMKKLLLSMGVVAEDADGSIYYNGPIRAHLKDGRKVEVGGDGVLPLKLKDLKNPGSFTDPEAK